MGSTVFTSGCLRTLEKACLTGLEHVQTVPLNPIIILVPGNLTSLHLSRRLALTGNAPGHINIRFMTLVDFARELCSGWLLQQALEDPPQVLQELLLEQILSSVVPDDGYFSVARGQGVLERTLQSTLTDLKEASITPKELTDWADSRSIAGGGASKYRELAKIYSEYTSRFESFRFIDRNDLLTKAAHAVCSATTIPLFIYGFYDFNPLQRKLLEAAVRHRDALIFFPWREGIAFDYALPSLTWLRRLGCEHLPLENKSPAPVAQLAFGLFDAPGHQPREDLESCLTIVSAPGEPREVQEIARKILSWVANGGHFSEIGILLRSAEPYAPLLAETFSRLSIPYYLHGGTPLWNSRAGQSLGILFKVLKEDFSRTSVMEFITYAPIAYDHLLGDQAVNAHPALWDWFSIEAGIVGGVSEWQERLDRLSRRLEWEEKEREKFHEERRDNPPVNCLEAFKAFVALFLTALREIPALGHWTDFARIFSSLLRRFLLRSPEVERVAEELDRLGRLDLLGMEVSPQRFARAAEAALTSARESSEGFGKGKVFIGEIMSARGLTFRMVVVPGMVEKFFPRSWRQDPILLDHERQYISEGLNKELAQKNRQYDEERLLFTLTVLAAEERVLFTFPRLEPLTGRERVPSFYLLRVLESATGRRAGFADFEAWPRVRRIPLSRLFPPQPHEFLDRSEYDLYQADQVLTATEGASLRYLDSLSPFFRRALEAEHNRWGEKRFTEHDGVLTGRAAQAALKRLYPRGATAFSPTRLECYARCPYRYFIEEILDLSPLDEPDPFAGISPLDRGSLIHDMLFSFLDRLKHEGRLPLKSQELSRLESILSEVAEQVFHEFEQDKVTGFPFLWRLQKAEILEDLKGWLETELAEGAGFVPAQLEVPFSCTLPLDGEEELKLRGRIDRIDVALERHLARIIDYKTGQPESLDDGSFKGGEALQLPVYLYATSHFLEGIGAEEAGYYYVTRASKYRKVRFSQKNWEEKFPKLQTIIAELVTGIRTGLFIARLPSCKRCLYPWICGPAAEILYHRKRQDPRIASFERVKEIP